MPVGTNHDVLEDVHPIEEAETLEGPGDTHAGQLVRPEPFELVAMPEQSPGVRLHEPAGDVEKCGLAGTVGADDAEHLVRPDVESHARQCDDPAEVHSDVSHREDGVRM